MTDPVVLKDLGSSFGDARDQNHRPTCLAFAASDAHAGLRTGWSPLSTEFAFYQAQRRAGRSPHEGALIDSMLDALEQDGQPEEAGWPYLKAVPTDLATWLPPASPGPLFTRKNGPCASDFQAIIANLDGAKPVMVLIKLSQAFFNPGASALIQFDANDPPHAARRHAIVAIAHGTVGGARAILVRNSWGPLWGMRGHVWLTEEYVDHAIFAAAILI